MHPRARLERLERIARRLEPQDDIRGAAAHSEWLLATLENVGTGRPPIPVPPEAAAWTARHPSPPATRAQAVAALHRACSLTADDDDRRANADLTSGEEP